MRRPPLKASEMHGNVTGLGWIRADPCWVIGGGRKEEKRLQLEEIARRAAAVEANRISGDASDVSEDGPLQVTTAGVLAQHKKKTSHIWSVFDLCEEKPSCLVMDAGEVCGNVPAPTGGTSNYWNHLFVHHRPVWLELKQRCGQLTGSGEAELAVLKQMSTSRAATAESEATFSKLPAEATRILDRVVVDWIIDTDGDKNEAELPSFRHLLSTATNGAYSGCCHQTVSGLITQSAAKGKATAAEFHSQLLSEDLKPTVSGDL